MKNSRFFFALFIGLLMVCASTFAQTTKQAELTLGGQKPAEKVAQAAETAKTEEVANAQETTATTETKREDSEEPEEQKVVLLVPFRLGTIFDLEILGVRFSLAIQPLGYGYGYGYPYYGSWYSGWGWNRYWYGNYWWNGGYYNYAWNSWEWNRQGWYRSHDRNRDRTNPIHVSQLRDPHHAVTTANVRPAEQTLIAQSNATAKSIRSISTQNPVKSYPSNNTVSRTQQKFNGRIAGKFTQSKQNPLFQKATPSIRSTANSRSILSRTQNTRSSTPGISNQPRPTSSRTAFRPTSRTGSSRISAPARSSTPRSTAVRSSGASRPSAARTSAPRASSSRGGNVRRK
ncbi:MAG: hypothetical protein Q8N59_00415 [bacterium]|nr:hypothetical protein [bacterium]